VATQASRDDAGSSLDGAVRVHRLRGTLRRLSVLFSDPERAFAPPIHDPEMTLGAPDKRKSTHRIDGTVALVMSLAIAPTAEMRVFDVNALIG
jgi:hypothetical protein